MNSNAHCPRRHSTTGIIAALILSVFVVFAATPAHPAASAPAPATIINADIAADTTWPFTGEPYIVTAPITVLSSATLTIAPGVEVRFAPAASLRIQGGLNAQGTQARQVSFVANNGVSWPGITIDKPARNITFQSAIVRQAVTGIGISQTLSVAVPAATSRVDILDSYFDSNGIGISANYIITTGAPRLTMRNSLVRHNGIGLLINGNPQGNLKAKLNHNSFVQNGIGLQALNVAGKGLKVQQQWWGAAEGPLVNLPLCSSSPAPGTFARDLVCGNVDYTPWSKAPSGRIIVAAGAGATLESAVGPVALSDDDSSPTSTITLTVPLGAFNQTVDLLVAPRPFSGSTPPGTPTSIEFEVTAAAGGQAIHTFRPGKQLRLDITYIAADLAGADPSKLKLYYLDETTGRWSFSGFASVPDPASNHLTVYLSHLSRMRITSVDASDVVEVFVPFARKG